MKKALVFVGFILISFSFVLWTRVQSVESRNGADLESMKNLKLIEKISENNMNENKNESMELKKFFNEEHTTCQSSIEKYENLVKTTENYVQRFISLFLITSNLLNHEVKDLHQMITIDLEVSISGEDLAYLQDYSKNIKDSFYQKNFSKLDAIFSKIAKLKERSFMENAVKSSKSFFASLNIFSVLNNPDIYHFFPLLIIFFVSQTIHNYIFHKSFYIFLGIFMNSVIFWESIQLYWKKIKEADIEIYVKTLQSKGIPEDCDMSNLKWYHNVLNLFFESKCLQYYKNINKNPVGEVSLFKCIIDTYSFYLIQTPFRILGASIRDFTGEISALWPWPFRYLVNIPIASFFGILFLLVILVISGKRLRLSFFGASIEFGDVKVVTEREKSVITSCETPREVRIIRKLKAWTKSRFPKRLEVDPKRRRKLYLNASKSICQVSEKSRLNFNRSDTSLNNSKIYDDRF